MLARPAFPLPVAPDGAGALGRLPDAPHPAVTGSARQGGDGSANTDPELRCCRHDHPSFQRTHSNRATSCRTQEFESVHDSVKTRPPETGQAMIYRVLDALTDSILEAMETVSDRVGHYEQEVVQRPRARDRDEMAVLRRSLGSFRRMLIIQRQVFDRAAERLVALSGDRDEAAAYYRDIGDHLWRAIDDVDMARESLQGMVDTYSNEVQERLTIVATIFLPLTVLTGFFGMNFNWLISHVGPAWAFWGLGVGGLVISAVAIAFWLRRSGMYGGRSRRPVR